jgi:hypothetical protein
VRLLEAEERAALPGGEVIQLRLAGGVVVGVAAEQ